MLLVVETILIDVEYNDPWKMDGLFPLPLVAVTGFLGVWMAVRLFRDRGLDPAYLW